MKMNPGKNLIVSKPALLYVIRALPDTNFKINWNHTDEYSILNILDNKTKQVSEATFTNGENLIFQHLNSSNPRVISAFEKVLGITFDDNFHQQYNTLYLDIDYHLMELYDYIQAKDLQNITKTKEKLSMLRENLLNLQLRSADLDDAISLYR